MSTSSSARACRGVDSESWVKLASLPCTRMVGEVRGPSSAIRLGKESGVRPLSVRLLRALRSAAAERLALPPGPVR